MVSMDSQVSMICLSRAHLSTKYSNTPLREFAYPLKSFSVTISSLMISEAKRSILTSSDVGFEKLLLRIFRIAECTLSRFFIHVTFSGSHPHLCCEGDSSGPKG